MWVRQTATTQRLPGAELLDRLDKQPTKHLAHGGGSRTPFRQVRNASSVFLRGIGGSDALELLSLTVVVESRPGKCPCLQLVRA